MKKINPSTLILTVLSMMLLASGCSIGGGSRTVVRPPTVGQQILDLQKARNAGAISEEEFQRRKAEELARR